MKTKPEKTIKLEVRTPEEIRMNHFKSFSVRKPKANKFRILEKRLIDGRLCYKFQYKTFWGWKYLVDECLYFPAQRILYLDSIKDAALFLQCHFGYRVEIVTKYKVL